MNTINQQSFCAIVKFTKNPFSRLNRRQKTAINAVKKELKKLGATSDEFIFSKNNITAKSKTVGAGIVLIESCKFPKLNKIQELSAQILKRCKELAKEIF